MNATTRGRRTPGPQDIEDEEFLEVDRLPSIMNVDRIVRCWNFEQG
jgi:hypothetical protein